MVKFCPSLLETFSEKSISICTKLQFLEVLGELQFSRLNKYLWIRTEGLHWYLPRLRVQQRVVVLRSLWGLLILRVAFSLDIGYFRVEVVAVGQGTIVRLLIPRLRHGGAWLLSSLNLDGRTLVVEILTDHLGTQGAGLVGWDKIVEADTIAS